jgi:outer membrane protein OmpA-like peptidoglycan-associated protein
MNGVNDNNVTFNNYMSFNAGAGARFWIYKGLGLRIQSSLKYFFNDGSYRHFQHSASILYKFGGYDEDNDGISDKFDDCPGTYGLKEFNGCPDSDNDGIQDSIDKCPEVFGIEALNGCPDSDGDGVTDKEDFCPFKKGLPKNNGCPDTDGDGIIDKQDACPTTPGVISYKGCPEPDSDGDGVPDSTDKCKYEPGTLANDGCPVYVINIENKLTDLASSILFVSGYNVFYPQGEIQLNRIAKLMIENNNLNFEIQGFTDNVGSPEDNYTLSLNRVNAVFDFLVSKGVNPANLKVKGHGESNPVASNNTPEGRAQNRRVVIKIIE